MKITKPNGNMEGFKYCYKQFNPLNGCRTLALGTTRYFRWQYKQNANLINDPYEGLAQVQVGQQFIGGKIAPSNYIYCMTDKFLTLDEAADAFKIPYDSYFRVKHFPEFMLYIHDCLTAQLKMKDFIPKIETNPIIINYFNNRNIGIWLLSAKVQYCHMKNTNGHLGITIGISDFNNIFERIAASNLAKPIEYIDQHEVRGLFVPFISLLPSTHKSIDFKHITDLPTDNGNIFLEVRDEQKIINVPDIMRYVG